MIASQLLVLIWRRYRSSNWRGGRVVDGSGLENQHVRKGIVGSNPTPLRSETTAITCFLPIKSPATIGQEAIAVCVFAWHLPPPFL